MKKNIIKNQDGATIIEFAIVAPIFFLALMGVVEFGLFFYANHVLENAATAASRYGLTGSSYSQSICSDPKGSKDRYGFIRCIMNSYTAGILDPDKIVIQTAKFDNFSSVTDDPEFPDDPNYGCGGDTILYNISYDWNFFTPFVGDFFSKDGVYKMTSRILVKNEDFSNNGDSTGECNNNQVKP